MSLTKGRIDRTGRVVFHDAALAIWEDGLGDARAAGGWEAAERWERQFKRDVFARIVQTLRRIGWSVGPGEHIFTGNNARYCRKGELKAELRLHGRHIELQFFQNVNAPDRPDHDGRYKRNQERHMPYLMRIEMERARRRIRDYLLNVFTGYVFDPPAPKIGHHGLTAAEYAAHSRRTSGHYRPALDRAEYGMTCNTQAVDGGNIEHGAKVWALDHKGRIITGTAYYSLNNNWDIVTGRYGLEHCHTGKIFTRQPENLRTKRNGKLRRSRLEKELSNAVAAMKFERAAVLRDILFPGDQPLFNVWSKRHQLYHRTDFCGYTPDQSKAGKFTASEVHGWDDGDNRVIAITAAKVEVA